MKVKRAIYGLVTIEAVAMLIFIGQKIYFGELHWYDLLLPTIVALGAYRLVRMVRNGERRREPW